MSKVEAIVFEIVTKSTLALAAIVAFAVWAWVGFPVWVPTLNRRK
jgi:hypothetical protein